MEENITLYNLTKDSVTLIKQQSTNINGVKYLIGEPLYRAYINSDSGREQLEKEIGEPYKSTVLTMWGSMPTVVIKDNTTE